MVMNGSTIANVHGLEESLRTASKNEGQSHNEVKSHGDSSMTWKANSNCTMTKIETVNPALY
jgi:hypothetical protein